MKIGWFTSAGGEGSLGLFKSTLNAINKRKINGSIDFVFINKDYGENINSDKFMEIVQHNKIPLITLSSKKFKESNNNKNWSELRSNFDHEIINMLNDYILDIAVHAGYMLIAPLLCKHFMTINIHPALPGETIGTWKKAIWDVIEQRLYETGAMVHISTEKVDEGPVLSFGRYSLSEEKFISEWKKIERLPIKEIKDKYGEDLSLFNLIRQKGLVFERKLLTETLVRISNNQISLKNTKPVDLSTSLS
ncbi:MAG: formyltransferase family protein [Dehalococcoidia bacterium]